MSVDQYLDALGSSLSFVLNWTGRQYGSPREMSLRAPFVDAATSIDPPNQAIFTSYYPYGAAVALALDLELRQRANGATLDDMMRLFWRTHGVTEKPYAMGDLHDALAEISGDRSYTELFFQRSIDGSQLPDFAPLLAQAGLTIRRANPRKAYLGQASVAEKDGVVKLSGYPEPGSALYKAGVSAGDQILTVNGKRITTKDGWLAALKGMTPGRTATLVIKSLGKRRLLTLLPAADPKLEIVRNETIGKTPSKAELAFRTAWLGAEGSMLPETDKNKD